MKRISSIDFTFNGASYTAVAGQTIAAALIDSGVQILRNTRFKNEPRSIFCGIGVCFDCLVIVDEIGNQRACLIEVIPEMRIESQR